MGAEQIPIDADAGNRRAKRARVLLSGVLKTATSEIPAILRDLSSSGALVDCRKPIAVGTDVTFVRGETEVPAKVAWAGTGRLGLQFAEPIDETELLIQISRPRPKP